ncbi:MAG: hypothetical protein ACRDH8_11545 [Actinomycetota bacterium]
MNSSAAGLRGRPGPRTEQPVALLAGFLGLLAFALFFLIRPFFDAAPAYRPRPPGTTYAYSYLVVAAFVPYALAAWAARRGVPVLWALVGTGVLHLVVLPAALTQSQDLYAYMFYGKMWAAHGANPYVDLPLLYSGDPWFPWMRWPDQVTVYGPVWTLLTGGVAALSGGSLPLAFALTKALILAFGLATVSAIVMAARLRREPPGVALLLGGWNPLVIVSLPLGGHADVAVAAAVIWALVADRRGRPLVATLLLTGATLVKAYAGVVLVVYLIALFRRGRNWLPAAATSLGVAALAYAPFWEDAATLSGLGQIGARASASLGGSVQMLLASVLGEEPAVWVVRLLGLAGVAAVIFVGARLPGFADDPWPAATMGFVAYIAVTPWFLYWHLVGALVLTAVAGSVPLRAATYTFSGTAMLTASFGATWWGRAVQTTLRYGLPAAALTFVRRREGETPPRSLRPRRSSA